MPSLRAKLIRFLLQHRHFFKFQLQKETFDWETSIPDFRQECEKMNSLLTRLPEGIEVSSVKIGDLQAEWLLPKDCKRDRVILYTHGGGYVCGSCQDHRAIVARFVTGCDVAALQFDYRLAPEHPFPAAIEDSVSAYRYLLEQDIDPTNIVIAGESAGGGLCLATLLSLREQEIPLPAAAVAISPWTDLACTGESYKSKADVCLSPGGSWTVFGKYYFADYEPTNPLISPLYGELQGLPPILLYAGEDEVLRDDSIAFAAKTKEAGVDITLNIGEGMLHCFPLLPPFVPEAKKAIEEIFAFINKHLKG
ncbi:alpha/beta hydrolase [Candidatus Riflebacteria bacterium]